MAMTHEVDDRFNELRRAGWSIGDTAFHGTDGRLVWVVSGTDGEN
jgi:hypothetical protein